MFPFGSKKNQGTTGTRGAQYNRDNNDITARPADAPQPATPAAPAPKKEQQPVQKPAERPLSQLSLEYNGMGILILHEINPGEQPQRIEQVIDSWKNTPKALRFDVLSFPRHFFCYDKQTGKINPSVVLPEKHAQFAQEEQDDRVREYMAELNGEKPATPVAGTLTAALINATSTEDLVDLFYNMKREDRQRVIDAGHKANNKRRQEAEARKQKTGGSGGEGGSGPKAQPAPRPQPVQKPVASQASGVSGTRRRRGG